MTEDRGADVITLPIGLANELFVALGEGVDSIEKGGGRVTGFAFVILGEKDRRSLVVQNFTGDDYQRLSGAVTEMLADVVDESRGKGRCPDCGGEAG